MAKARQSGCITTGRVVKNDYRRFTGPEGRYRSEIVTYEYFVDGKRFEKKITYTDTGIVVNYPGGKILRIVPAQPDGKAD